MAGSVLRQNARHTTATVKKMKHFSELSPAAERIVDEAEDLVKQLGFNGFSYEDIAQRVGIRKPSIHHHFPSKAELVVVMTQRYAHRFQLRLESISAKDAAASARLRAHAELFAETFSNGRRLCVCGMLGSEMDSLPEPLRAEVSEFFAANLAWLEGVITAGQARQELDTRQLPAKLASLWLSALEGAMLVGRGLGIATPSDIAEALLSSWTNG